MGHKLGDLAIASCLPLAEEPLPLAYVVNPSG
jgi:hypothetical protein